MTQLERADLHAAIDVRYPDNTSEDITPALLRAGLHELVDSVFVTATDTGAVPNVPRYQATATYAVGFVVRYTLPGSAEAFFAALQAGKLPAPVAVGDVNWKVVPGPVPATQLGQYLTLAQAQGINGDTVVLGRDYEIELPQLSASGHAQYLSVAGIAENWLASDGWLIVNNVRTKVKNIDYAAGTWEVDQSTALQAAVFARTPTGFLGYADLDSAFLAQQNSLELNRYLYQLKKTALVDDLTLNGNGASITLATGVTLTLANLKILRDVGLSQGQGTLEEDGTLSGAAYGNSTVDGLKLNGGVLSLFDQAVASNCTGTGTIYIYDDSQLVNPDPAITVLDRRVSAVDAYTKVQADALLATKQGAVTEQVDVTAYGPANSLLRNNFDQYLRLITSQDAELNLPPCTLADVGRILALHNYSGPGSDATQTVQATLATDPSPSFITKVLRGYVALLEVVRLVRGTPFNDVVATYAVLANTPVVPVPPPPTVTPAQLTTAKTILPFTTVTTAYALQLSDLGTVVRVNSPTDVVLTVPDYATTPLPLGADVEVGQIGAGRGLITKQNNNVSIGAYPAGASKTAGQYASVFLHHVDSNTWNLASAVV